MNFVALTQRVETYTDINEKRDALDERWSIFLERMGVFPFPLPNYTTQLELLFQTIPFKGIILTGGGDLSSYSTENISAERERMEKELIELAIKAKIPIIGICRGMQILAHYFDIPSRKLPNHGEKRHPITVHSGTYLSQYFPQKTEVNSYHQYAPLVEEMNDSFRIASTCGNIVEAIEHRSYPFFGLMWHPEREEPFRETEIQFFRDIFDL